MTASFVLWLPNQILDFVLMLFGCSTIEPGMRTFVVGCIAFFMYTHLLGFVLSFIRHKLMGNGKGTSR